MLLSEHEEKFNTIKTNHDIQHPNPICKIKLIDKALRDLLTHE